MKTNAPCCTTICDDTILLLILFLYYIIKHCCCIAMIFNSLFSAFSMRREKIQWRLIGNSVREYDRSHHTRIWPIHTILGRVMQTEHFICSVHNVDKNAKLVWHREDKTRKERNLELIRWKRQSNPSRKSNASLFSLFPLHSAPFSFLHFIARTAANIRRHKTNINH